MARAKAPTCDVFSIFLGLISFLRALGLKISPCLTTHRPRAEPAASPPPSQLQSGPGPACRELQFLPGVGAGSRALQCPRSPVRHRDFLIVVFKSLI